MKLKPYHYFAQCSRTMHILDSHAEHTYCGLSEAEGSPNELCDVCLAIYAETSPKEQP